MPEGEEVNRTKMYQECKFKDTKEKVCAYCGKDGNGILYCGIAKTNAKGNHILSNQIERMTKCPRERKRH